MKICLGERLFWRRLWGLSRSKLRAFHGVGASQTRNLKVNLIELKTLVAPAPNQTTRDPRPLGIRNKEIESQSDTAQNCGITKHPQHSVIPAGYHTCGWQPDWFITSSNSCKSNVQKKNSLQRIDQVLQIPTAWARSLKLKQRDWKQSDWSNSDPSMAIAHDVRLLHKSESVNGRRLGKNIIAHRHENLSWRKAFLEALVEPVPKQTSRIPRRWSITNKELESESDRAQNACCACTESNYAWPTTLGHQKQGNWKPIRHSPKLRHHKTSTTLCDSSWMSYMWMTAWLVYNKFKFLQIQCPKKNSLQRIDQVLHIPTAWARSLKLKQRDWKQGDWSNSDPSMAIAHDVWLLHKSESVNGRRLGENSIAHRHENLSWG